MFLDRGKKLLLFALLQPAPLWAETAEDWVSRGKASLQAALKLEAKHAKAKNVILFVGDGMGISTITATRIFAGQKQGLDGEAYQLAFEKLPFLALSKTYSANQQTPDSAPTMSAMVTGVKTNQGVLSLDQSVDYDEMDSAKVKRAHRKTLLEMAEEHGLATGIVTTTRITHATPAANYAHTSNRNWEADSDIPDGVLIPDIASQLIDRFGDGLIGDGIEVLMGGGRSNFLPVIASDPEYPDVKGKRNDGRNLIQEYQDKFSARYVWNLHGFKQLDRSRDDRVLALFEPSHMQYEHDRNLERPVEPNLAEMTCKAIEILKNNKKGFYLMVEGGRIDHAHHAGNAYRALSDTVAFSDAVAAAMKLVNLEDTLIVVTADHSHVFTIAGYPKRGNPILGKVIGAYDKESTKALDQKPFTTLGYINGMGFKHPHPHTVEIDDYSYPRTVDQSDIDTEHPDYHQEAMVPLKSETHAGEDVPVYAGGPFAHLFHGVQEQSYIFYVIEHALGWNQSD